MGAGVTHNPEVEGSNPSPAYQVSLGQRPSSEHGRGPSACAVCTNVHEASEGAAAAGGEVHPGDVVRDAGGERTSTEAQHERLR